MQKPYTAMRININRGLRQLKDTRNTGVRQHSPIIELEVIQLIDQYNRTSW